MQTNSSGRTLTSTAATRRGADALIASEYPRLKPVILATVRRRLAASGVRLPDADLDAVYNQAWHASTRDSLRASSVA